jgi:hypothetical protein
VIDLLDEALRAIEAHDLVAPDQHPEKAIEADEMVDMRVRDEDVLDARSSLRGGRLERSPRSKRIALPKALPSSAHIQRCEGCCSATIWMRRGGDNLGVKRQPVAKAMIVIDGGCHGRSACRENLRI